MYPYSQRPLQRMGSSQFNRQTLNFRVVHFCQHHFMAYEIRT
jgi:hypothetical protein